MKLIISKFNPFNKSNSITPFNNNNPQKKKNDSFNAQLNTFANSQTNNNNQGNKGNSNEDYITCNN